MQKKRTFCHESFILSSFRNGFPRRSKLLKVKYLRIRVPQKNNDCLQKPYGFWRQSFQNLRMFLRIVYQYKEASVWLLFFYKTAIFGVVPDRQGPLKSSSWFSRKRVLSCRSCHSPFVPKSGFCACLRSFFLFIRPKSAKEHLKDAQNYSQTGTRQSRKEEKCERAMERVE